MDKHIAGQCGLGARCMQRYVIVILLYLNSSRESGSLSSGPAKSPLGLNLGPEPGSWVSEHFISILTILFMLQPGPERPW